MRMGERKVVAVSETSVSLKQNSSRVGGADKPVTDSTLFNDWKRFCFVLREIATGVRGRALSGLEAQKRAQDVLNQCGYSWQGGPVVRCRVGPQWNLQQSPSKPRQKVELERVHVQHAGTVIRAQGNVASMLRQTAVPRNAPPTGIPNSFNAQAQPGRCKLNEARSFTASLS